MFLCAAIFTRPALPVWLILALWLAGVGWTWWSLRSCGLRPRLRHGLLALRAAALTLLSLLLLLPERRTESVQSELPVLAVAVDVSASLQEPVPEGRGELRSGRVREELQAGAMRRGLENFRVWWFEIADGVEEVSGPPAGPGTFQGARSLLMPALNRIAARLQGQNTAGILLLTDGLDQSGAALTAAAREVPVYALELEEPRAAEAAKPDAWIAEVNYPRRAVVNWKTSVDVMVRRQPATAAGVLPVNLIADGKTLQSVPVTWAAGESFRVVPFEFTPEKVGQWVLRAEILPPPEADAQPLNNRREFMIEVLDPENRVLYLEGSPRWEFKFLKRALLADRGVLLSAFVGNGAGAFVNFSEEDGKGSGAAAALAPPAFTAAGLAKYKVVILGDLPSTALRPEDLKGLAEFVDKGGGLLIVGGPQSCAPDGLCAAPELAAILPVTPGAGSKVREGRFAVDVPPGKRTHPALQGLNPELPLPSLLSIYAPVKTGPLAEILLATGDGDPLLAVRACGQGRSAVILSDSLWHWRLGDTETGGGRGATRYQNFYAQLVTWLGPRQDRDDRGGLVQLYLGALEADARQPVAIGAVLSGVAPERAGLTCRIRTPAGTDVVLPMAAASLGPNVGLNRPQPGFLCEYRPVEPGTHTVSVAAPDGSATVSVKLLVREPFAERTGAPADHAWLEALCRGTGGVLVPWKERGRLPDLIPHQPREYRSISETALWPNPAGLVLLVALLCAEWWLRRQRHLA